jgi:hypothetical protein
LSEFFSLAERFKLVRKFLTLLFSGPLLAISIVALALTAAGVAISPVNASSSPIEINSVAELSCTSVEILFKSSVPKKSLAYYVITATADPSRGQAKSIKKIIKTKATGLITAEMKSLNPSVAYKFSISAKTNKAKSINSETVEYVSICNLMDLLSNLPADWGNPKPIQLPAPAPTTPSVALPAFTLSSSSETRTVNTAATGFTINSTGGAISSFAINATPAGMSFSNSTGALTGTPTSVASATAYTITATNASGSATQTFNLTVTAAVIYRVGDTGPGGGKIFYKAATPFACGPSFPSLSQMCTYLEVAPPIGYDLSGLPWSTGGNQNISVPGAYEVAIGSGYKNSLAIAAQAGNVAASSAAMTARAYTGGGMTDWYLPSKDELNQLRNNKDAIGGGFHTTNYWSSTETNSSNASKQHFNGSAQGASPKSAGESFRPIRAF